MMSHLPMHFLLLVFLFGGGFAQVTTSTSDNAINCGYDNFCQAMTKLMSAVSVINNKLDEQAAACPGFNEKVDKQAQDLEQVKAKLDRSLTSISAVSTELQKLSASILSHDASVKAHITSTGTAGNANKLLQSIYGAELGPRDCTDIRAMGYSTSGIYRIYPGSDIRRIEADVYCDFSSSSENWLVIQRRRDGSENFDRTWREYERGFGALSGEFWLGNEKLSLLTMNKRYKLRIEMEEFGGTRRWAEYSTFSVRPASDKYRLTALGISGNAGPGDNLAYHTGRVFGTKDADNGLHLSRCNPPASGGWWFNACLFGNMNARYRSIFWYYVGRSYHSLRATEMKIAAVP